jgi:hypothetical protein
MAAPEIFPGIPIDESHEKSEDGEYWIMRPEFREKYQASVRAQLDSWIAGTPEHNHFAGECCPDFSCCSPQNIWPLERRQKFADGDAQTRERMCFESIAESVASFTGIPVLIIGESPVPEHPPLLTDEPPPPGTILH